MFLNNLRKAVLSTIIIGGCAWVLTTALYVAAAFAVVASGTATIANNEEGLLLATAFSCYHLLLVSFILWLNIRQQMSYSAGQLATILTFLIGPLVIIGGDVGKFFSTPFLMVAQLFCTAAVLLVVFTAKEESLVPAEA